MASQSAVLRVTQVLQGAGLSPDFSAIPPDVLETARQRGTAVHACCELLDVGDLFEPSIDPQIAGYVDGYKRFLRETAFRAIDTEQRMTHPALAYSGQYDVTGWIDGVRVLIDRKATASLDPVTAVQTAAYAEMHNALRPAAPVMARYALHLRRDGTYSLKQYQSAADWSVFLAALEVVRLGPQYERAQEVVTAWKQQHRR